MTCEVSAMVTGVEGRPLPRVDFHRDDNGECVMQPARLVSTAATPGGRSWILTGLEMIFSGFVARTLWFG